MRSARKSSIPRLSVNHIAAAALRSDKRGWLSLAAGIFLALFVVSATVLAVEGVITARREKTVRSVGYENCILIDHPQVSDEQLRGSGQFDEIGHIYVTACLKDIQRYIGCYDETAQRLLNRQIAEGRMPLSAGEIAVDESAAEFMRADIKVGDEIVLQLIPLSGAAEERVFTVTGILADQALDPSLWFHDDAGTVANFPSIITSNEESAFATGRTAVHRLMTLRDGVYLQDVMKDNWNRYDGKLFCINEEGYLAHHYDAISFAQRYLNLTTLLMALLGVSLALVAGVGVAQAMESQLARRVEEIGMLRCVGATHRQIRRIFGRQTWLIALGLAPVSAAGGCAFVLALSRLLPDTVAFHPTLKLIAPVVILSIACVWLSSSLPLRRASRAMPMSVIRDTALLRKAGRLKSEPSFKAASLMARRQIILRPARQTGAALMAALSMICAAAGILGAADGLRDVGGADYIITNQDPGYFYRPPFSDRETAGRFLTEGDINQLRALPHMNSVVLTRRMRVNLLMDEAKSYLTLTNPYLAEDNAEWRNRDRRPNENDAAGLLAPTVKAYLGTDKVIAEYDLIVIESSDELMDALSAMVTQGRIDAEALDAGREALVCAPTVCLMERRTNDGRNYSTATEEITKRYYGGWDEIYRWENDAFSAGDTLSIAQIMSPRDAGGDVAPVIGDKTDAQAYAAYLDSCVRFEASVRVGAVLGGIPGDASERFGLSLDDASCLIVTEKGLRAMGLAPRDIYDVSMCLDGYADDAAGEYLSRRVRAIASRAESAYVYDGVQAARSRRGQSARLVTALAAMTLMFFAVTVSLESGSVSRGIRADQRVIGTLRAVGADGGVFARCYGAQIVAGLGAGLIAALAVGASLALIAGGQLPKSAVALSFAAMALLGALLAVFCLIALRITLGETLKKSVVENIREL